MLSDAIASLGANSYTITHRAYGGTDGHGRVTAPTTTTATIVGMIQPLSGREIDRMPEGLHGKELRAFWTTSALSVADSETQQMGDRLIDAGVTWEVVRVENWTQLAPFNRYTLSRVDA